MDAYRSETMPHHRKTRRLAASAILLVLLITGCFWDDEGGDDPPPSGGGDAGAFCAAPTPDRCGGDCVDLRSDPQHCGACNDGCETDCLNGACISCPNVNGRWEIVGGDCPVAYCVIGQNASCGGSVTCFDDMGEAAGSGTVDVFDGSVLFSATAGSCNLDVSGDTANGPCTALGGLVGSCTVNAVRVRRA